MPKKFNILKCRDHTDSYYTEIDTIFSLPCRIIINGRSQLSGKTTTFFNWMCRSMYYRDYFLGVNIFIVSNNKLDNKISIMMEQLDVPPENYMAFDEDTLDLLYDQLESEFINEVALGDKPANRMIIFDDCAYSGSLKNKQAGILNKILMNGRHLNLSSIITSQKYSLISTGVRSNCTGAVCFNTNQKELELIAEDHSYLEKKSQFISLFRSATKEKNSAMIINYSNPPEQMYQNINFEVLKHS